MSAPNKRRKKNDFQASPKTVRSIDSFFGKPKQNGATEAPKKEVDEETLSDEALARKLQAEWDEQDRIRSRDEGEQRSVSPSKPPQEQANGQGEALGDIYGLSEELEGEDASVKAKSDDGNDFLSRAVDEDPPTQPESIPHTIPDTLTIQESQAAPTNLFLGLGKRNTLSLQSATAEEDTITNSIPFDSSPLTFDPSTYIPSLQKQWTTSGGNTTYALLTRCFIQVNSTQSRIKIVDTLVNTLRTIIESDPSSLLPTVWLATNSISPPYIDLELGLGGSAISKALKKVCGLDNAGLKKLYDKHGDAGDVAFEAKKRQSLTLRKPKPLTVKSVFECLVKIANAKGTGSVEAKQRIVERLVQDARGAEESRYIVRTLVQHLRIGAVKTTMLIALSRAFLLSKPPGAEFPVRDRTELAKLNKQDLADAYARGEELVKACFARRPNYVCLLFPSFPSCQISY